ncbi:MAG TPA: glycine--tRNA ligase subunit beta [Caulobacteraceae bacterium]
MPQFLLELLSEEIPARMQPGAARDLERLARDHLARVELAFEGLTVFAGPRRLTLVVEDLPAARAHRVEERKGPRVGAPESALEGFLRSAGVAREALTQRDGSYFARLERPGRPTAEVLGEMVEALVRSFPWPKSMTWGTGALRWVRPLRRILCLFDGVVVALCVDGVASGDLTEGHRFMGSREPFPVRDFDDYRQGLARNFVVLEAAERRRRILDGARSLCASRGLELVEDEGLADEVTGLVEWPQPLLGDMDLEFLSLPREVIGASMRTHQRYFSLSAPGAEGLAPHFITVANIEAADGGALIAAGNARVLKARLGDARFFWDEDQRTSLENRLEKLKGVTFHAGLGSLFERSVRMEALARAIAPLVGADADMAGGAARLAKADLASGMVAEFPELQGVMGGYYARAEGLDDAIAQAIAQQYKPQGPRDSLPVGPVPVAVALADKVDTLVGLFEIGEKPTGSRDPFALRRTALGVIRIAIDSGARLPLRSILAYAGVGCAVSVVRNMAKSRLNNLTYKQAIADFADPASEFAAADWLERHFEALHTAGPAAALAFWRGSGDAAWIEEILAFLADRLKVLLREQGRRHDLVDAVFALGDDDLARVVARIDALAGFLESGEGANLLAGYRRAANILTAESRKGPLPEGPPVLLAGSSAPEIALLEALGTALPLLDRALARDDFTKAMGALAALRQRLDAFFDKVLVNSPDAGERDNRLRLLLQVGAAMGRVADFSMVTG